MAAAIDFHDEPVIETDQIKEVSAKWRLPPEAIAVGSKGAQMPPKHDLLWRQ
jgi:hypothetical protein